MLFGFPIKNCIKKKTFRIKHAYRIYIMETSPRLFSIYVCRWINVSLYINLLNVFFFLGIFARRVSRIYSVTFGLKQTKRIDRFVPILDRTFNWQDILWYDGSFLPIFMHLNTIFIEKKKILGLHYYTAVVHFKILYCPFPSNLSYLLLLLLFIFIVVWITLSFKSILLIGHCRNFLCWLIAYHTPLLNHYCHCLLFTYDYPSSLVILSKQNDYQLLIYYIIRIYYYFFFFTYNMLKCLYIHYYC